MKTMIFDLDGTLLDTSLGIMESIRYASAKLGYPELPMEQLLTFIGPPLTDSFMRCYGCDKEKADLLTAAYREHYREGALLNAKPYDGILDVCRQLKERGLRLAVATSKPQMFSEQILHHFGFDGYMTEIHGADLEGRLSKTDLIRLCVGNSDPSDCIMVGDTEHDARGAMEASVPFIGVSYGFGNLKEMKQYPMIGVAKAPSDILRIIQESEDR